ncbi:MAG: thioredoxin [Patescibacteria group bacterium]
MHITVTDSEFDAKVVKSDKPTLVDFWAEWCGPCRMQNPILEELDLELGDKGIIAKMDVDANPQVPGQYGIMSIPTLMLFHKGQMVKSWIGVQSKEVLKSEFDKLMS